jgi:hypothetical protein
MTHEIYVLYFDHLPTMIMSQDPIWIRNGSNIKNNLSQQPMNLSQQLFRFWIANGMTNTLVHPYDIMFLIFFPYILYFLSFFFSSGVSKGQLMNLLFHPCTELIFHDNCWPNKARDEYFTSFCRFLYDESNDSIIKNIMTLLRYPYLLLRLHYDIRASIWPSITMAHSPNLASLSSAFNPHLTVV